MFDETAIPSNNGAIITIYQIIKAVMSSDAEAELGALFINFQEAIPACQVLEIMGHRQPPTPIHTYNTTSPRTVNDNIARKQLKSMEMKLHWLCCRIAQK